jgi:hypothetical protein
LWFCYRWYAADRLYKQTNLGRSPLGWHRFGLGFGLERRGIRNGLAGGIAHWKLQRFHDDRCRVSENWGKWCKSVNRLERAGNRRMVRGGLANEDTLTDQALSQVFPKNSECLAIWSVRMEPASHRFVLSVVMSSLLESSFSPEVSART